MSTAQGVSAQPRPTNHARPAFVGHPASDPVMLDRLVREQLRRIASVCETLPSRAFTEAGRAEHRPLGLVTIARALMSARTDGVPYDVCCGVAEVVHAWIRDIYGHARVACVAEALAHETKEQAEADVAQMRGLTSPSLGAIDHAIEETVDAITAQRAYLDTLLRQRFQLTTGVAA